MSGLDLKMLVNALKNKDLEVLKTYRFVLWISFLGPKTSYREFRLYQVEEDFEVFALYGFKLLLNGDELINSISAFEVTRNIFVTVNSSIDDEWKSWLEMIINGKKPRVIFNETYRRRLGLPTNTTESEILILSIIKYDEIKEE